MGLRSYFRRLKKNNEGFKKVQVGNYKLTANSHHLIEDYLTSHKYYSRNLPRIAKYLEQKYPTYAIIDVGANIGDTIALLRSAGVNQMVYLIEGEHSYFELLQQNLKQFANFVSIHSFLGEYNDIEAGVVDAKKGTAKIKFEAGKQTTIRKLDAVAAAYAFETVKLLKTDTDGFDFKIIRGSYDLIRKDKPVLFFEYDAAYLNELDPDGNKTLIDLQQMGYNKAMFYDNYGKLLISTSLKDTQQLQQLFTYMNNGDGAFPYFDVCVFHLHDDALADDIIALEMAYYTL